MKTIANLVLSIFIISLAFSTDGVFFKDIKFYRVIPKDWFLPKDLEWNGNISHMTTEQLLSKFELQIKI